MSNPENTDSSPQNEEEQKENEVKEPEENSEEEDEEKDEAVEQTDNKPEDDESQDPNTKQEPEAVVQQDASPKKSPKKKKKIDKEEEDDEEEELPLGLLERPVVIESGKREKKKVERLSMTMTLASQEKKKVNVPEGSGVKLGDCPRIEFKINRKKADELKTLHRILYSKPGSAPEVKKNIRQFCGYTFSKGDKEYEKRHSQINKLHLAALKPICELLDLEKKGTKDDIVQRLIEFLMSPYDSGKKVPKPKKRGRASKKGEKKGVKRKRSEKKKKTSKEDVDSEDNDDDDDDDDDGDVKENDGDEDGDEAMSVDDEDAEEEEEQEESEEEAPKKKKAKIESSKPVKKEKEEKKDNDTTKKVKKEKEKVKKEVKKKTVESSDESDSEDEALSSIKKGPPTNDELRDVVKKILDGANLEEVTMKTVVKQVYRKYPAFDLTDKKEFIKNTVKQLIS